jgi:hypothetical protein
VPDDHIPGPHPPQPITYFLSQDRAPRKLLTTNFDNSILDYTLFRVMVLVERGRASYELRGSSLELGRPDSKLSLYLSFCYLNP